MQTHTDVNMMHCDEMIAHSDENISLRPFTKYLDNSMGRTLNSMGMKPLPIEFSRTGEFATQALFVKALYSLVNKNPTTLQSVCHHLDRIGSVYDICSSDHMLIFMVTLLTAKYEDDECLSLLDFYYCLVDVFVAKKITKEHMRAFERQTWLMLDSDLYIDHSTAEAVSKIHTETQSVSVCLDHWRHIGSHSNADQQRDIAWSPLLDGDVFNQIY